MTGPSQSIPSQRERALDLLDRLRDLAARVGVLDPEQALAAAPAGEEPVEEERAHAADVEEAGRARSHADAGRHGGHGSHATALPCPRGILRIAQTDGSERIAAQHARSTARAPQRVAEAPTAWAIGPASANPIGISTKLPKVS